MIFNSVVLPEPFAPINATLAPSPTRNEMSSSSTLPSGRVKPTPFKSIWPTRTVSPSTTLGATEFRRASYSMPCLRRMASMSSNSLSPDDALLLPLPADTSPADPLAAPTSSVRLAFAPDGASSFCPVAKRIPARASMPTPIQASGEKTSPTTNPTMPMAEAPMSRNPPAAICSDAAQPFARPWRTDKATRPRPTTATAISIASVNTHPGYVVVAGFPSGISPTGPLGGPSAVARRAYPLGQLVVRRIADTLQREPMRRGHDDSGVTLPGSQDLRRPIHRAPAVTDRQQRPDHRAHLVVAEGIGLHRRGGDPV